MPTTPRQNTLARAGEMEGVGLHTGAGVRMCILPAPVNTGVVFRRTDLEGSPEVPADVAHVVGTDLGTSVGIGEAKIHTVEHLLAALVSREIDNAYVELSAAELPAGDGSARVFDALLEECGAEQQDAPARILAVAETFSLAKDRSRSFEKLIDGVPTIIVADGRPLPERMRKARVDEQDIMEAARRLHGLERLDQIKYAVFEVSGGISVIPREQR